MTTEQREEMKERLELSSRAVKKAVEGLADYQWRFVPAEGGWSVGQCMEHIAHVETTILSMLHKAIENSPADQSLLELAAGKDRKLIQFIPDRSRKAQMPANLDFPQGTKPSPILLKEFDSVRDQSIQFLMNATVDISLWTAEHFVFKTLNGGQWILFIALHAERHASQIMEIRQHEGFPA